MSWTHILRSLLPLSIASKMTSGGCWGAQMKILTMTLSSPRSSGCNGCCTSWSVHSNSFRYWIKAPAWAFVKTGFLQMSTHNHQLTFSIPCIHVCVGGWGWGGVGMGVDRWGGVGGGGGVGVCMQSWVHASVHTCVHVCLAGVYMWLCTQAMCVHARNSTFDSAIESN